MKVALFFVALCASLASAAVVKTPVFDDQIVPNQGDDCALGVTTPQGCAPRRGGARRNTAPL
ncbi:hypothetical protein F5883DRAFT_146765 [Diaporthe sp. PMI_573]|nr:hypothetical protein F5883DRAFT_146765 [Diaporthaceae sp. PMI_573]